MSDTLDQPESQKPKENSFGSVLSIIVSLFFIVRGSMYMGTNRQTWGIVLLLVGIVGLAIKVYTLTQKK